MPEENNLKNKWEKRWHPLRQEWVVYAAHRNNRPWHFDKKEAAKPLPAYDAQCYLCPGNARVSGAVNPQYADVFIFDNDHPVVGLHAPLTDEWLHDGLYNRASAKGIAKVVCYHPQHNTTLNDVSVAHVAKVFA
ncbi:MAG TPA: galactose-1-phosphate uridylyltransferase, partial [Chitinophagaceae bacterium]|nr:galactose-1-phosphate uridylyltransferase [Chitinophagaceae bacterium]